MSDEISLPRFEMRPLSAEEGDGYLIEFPDFPGCIADGATPDEAMREGVDALKSYRETLKQLPALPETQQYGGHAQSQRQGMDPVVLKPLQ